MMFTLSNYPMNFISISKALSLFQQYLQEVTECQHILEVFTNNILASLVTQL